ncbi:unnamed protein product, partial [Adineta ricciae]
YVSSLLIHTLKKSNRTTMKIFCALFVLLYTSTISSLELKKLSSCQTALGMQSGSIPDSAISASSSYDSNSVGPKASR